MVSNITSAANDTPPLPPKSKKASKHAASDSSHQDHTIDVVPSIDVPNRHHQSVTAPPNGTAQFPIEVSSSPSRPKKRKKDGEVNQPHQFLKRGHHTSFNPFPASRAIFTGDLQHDMHRMQHAQHYANIHTTHKSSYRAAPHYPVQLPHHLQPHTRQPPTSHPTFPPVASHLVLHSSSSPLISTSTLLAMAHTHSTPPHPYPSPITTSHLNDMLFVLTHLSNAHTHDTASSTLLPHIVALFHTYTALMTAWVQQEHAKSDTSEAVSVAGRMARDQEMREVLYGERVFSRVEGGVQQRGDETEGVETETEWDDETSVEEGGFERR